jgi:mycofactocin system creatininase family protein
VSGSLGALTWVETEAAASSTLLAVPIGSTEQHGPHLPLSTDTDIALALAEALARQRPDVVVAPSVPYGSSGEHADFAGTLSVGQEALELLLVELGRSASKTFSRTLLISAHGGNQEPVLRALRRLRSEGQDVRAFFPRWGGDAHAGRTETSLVLAIDPPSVRLEHAAAGATTPVGALMPRLVQSGVRSVSPNGVLGNPVGSSAEEGQALLRHATEQLTELFDRWWETG